MQTLTESLDPRRLSMLKAMGVELWWAKAPKAVEGAAVVAAPVVVKQTPAANAAISLQPQAVACASQEQAPLQRHSVASEPQPVLADVPAPAAQSPVAAPAAAPVIERVAERARPVAASPSAAAGSAAVVWTAPIAWQKRQGHALTDSAADAEAASAGKAPGLLLLVDDLHALGDAQPAAMQLLENMVRAMGLAHSPTLQLSWAKRVPPQGEAEAPARPEPTVATAAQVLEHAPITAVLAMGRDAAQQWLGRTEPLGVLRQDNHLAHKLPVVVTYSPAYLLRATHAKRQAWADLQRAMALLAAAAQSSIQR